MRITLFWMWGNPVGWDDEWLADPWVLFDGSIYHMWYHAWNGIGNQVQIGHATSPHPDSAWTKDPNNPVLSYESGKWDYPRVQAPCVIYDGDLFHMWYSGGQTSEYRIGYATSMDGSQWTKSKANPVLPVGSAGSWDDTFVGFCSVIESTSSRYKMWYTGGNVAGEFGIGYATSPISILNVPDQYATIQEGIEAADSGDVVLVDEGTYYENINFKGKAITVASHYYFDGDTSHISRTIIDGSQPTNPDSGSVVYFISGEDTTSVLFGFTITGGSGTYLPNYNAYGGGGILMTSGGKILHNRIKNNTMEKSKLLPGAGMLVLVENTSYSVIISHNQFIYNSSISHVIAASCGGGIYCKWKPFNGFLRINNNLITYNSVTNTSRYKAIAGGLGVAFDLPTSVDAVIENNIILNNEVHSAASMGAGLYVVYWEPGGKVIDAHPTPLIINNIIANNHSDDRGAGIGIWTVEKNHSSNSEITPQPVIINNTIVNNKANDGSGIFNFDSHPLLLNNFLWNDLSVSGSREVFNDDIFYPDYTDPNSGALNIYYTDIQGGWAGAGEENRNAEPLFVDAEDGDFHLVENSPGIGWGTESILVSGKTYTCPVSDYYGNIRPYPIDAGVDMGAIESEYLTDIRNKVIPFPATFALKQNYPNPFNPITNIEYRISKSEHVELSIYNLLGQKMATLVNKNQPSGSYQIQWDAAHFSSGVYYYKIKAGAFLQVKKMILIK